jgi:hypothetical protein
MSNLTKAQKTDLEEKVNNGPGLTREELALIINSQDEISYKELLMGITHLGTQFGGFGGGMSSDKLWLICDQMNKTPRGALVAKFFTLGCHMARMQDPASRSLDGYYG